MATGTIKTLMSDRGFGWFCQISGLRCRQDPDHGLTVLALRYEAGRFLALQHATVGLEP